MRILLAPAISAALLGGCATYQGPGYDYGNGYASPYYYDNGYYAYGYDPGYYGYGPGYYSDPYYYGPGFSGSFSYYNYDRDGHYYHDYGGYNRSYTYQGSVTPNAQAGTSSGRASVRAHRDRSNTRVGAEQRQRSVVRAEQRQQARNSVARAEQRQQARSTRQQSAQVASSGRVTNEQREHGG